MGNQTSTLTEGAEQFREMLFGIDLPGINVGEVLPLVLTVALIIWLKSNKLALSIAINLMWIVWGNIFTAPLIGIAAFALSIAIMLSETLGK